MMLLLISCVVLLANHGGAEEEGCDTRQLSACLKLVPPTPVGLPRSKTELDLHCQAYYTGMGCMEPWISRCLPTDSQKLVQQQIQGARSLMHLLCSNDSSTRKEYLRESSCWQRVSPEWSGCVSKLQQAVREISERSQLVHYFHKNGELCCARNHFMVCVEDVGLQCSANARSLLRHMARVLAEDAAACGTGARAHCAAAAALGARALVVVPLLARAVDLVRLIT